MFTRMGFRPNNGWADALHVIYLGGKRVAFTYGRRDIGANLGQDTDLSWSQRERQGIKKRLDVAAVVCELRCNLSTGAIPQSPQAEMVGQQFLERETPDRSIARTRRSTCGRPVYQFQGLQ